MPDYTNQLNEIVHLLSRPGISPLLMTAVAALLGVIGGACGRAIELWFAGRLRRSHMRDVLYRDVATMFFRVDAVTSFREQWADSSVRDDAFRRLSIDLDFEAETYITANREVFMQLEERPASKHIYSLFHRIVSDGAKDMELNCRAAQWMLGKYIRDGSLHAGYFRKRLPKNQADHLIERATKIYDASMREERERQKENEK